MVVCPYIRSEVTTLSVGKLHLELSIVSAGLKECGVLL